MPHKPKGVELGSPADWLKRAKSNLAIALQKKSDAILWEDLCFEIQQSVEKSLKAVLIMKNIKFRFVHDIAELLTLFETNGILFPEKIRAAASLTDYSVETRYPGPYEPVTEDEFNEGLEIAKAVMLWAESEIETHS